MTPIAMSGNLRRTKKPPPPDPIIGLPFYDPTEFEKQLQHADDEIEFSSYQEWLAAHNQIKEQLTKLGLRVVDVPINADEMHRYFQEHGLRNDAANRSQYVARKLFAERNPNKRSANLP
ncbi:MAG TPA: hypothetical protein VNM72_11785 [Blastocatellia bacterium]|nr:hypothetical protein [Blastocatellia bacterium]